MKKDLRRYVHMRSNTEVIDIIYKRKSTRNYNPDFRIDKETQEKILKAGLRAPSPKNRQPWHYVVVDDHKTLKKVQATMEEALTHLKSERVFQKRDFSDLSMAFETAKIIGQCSMLVFVCYERDESNEHGEVMQWPLSAAAFEVADIQAIGACIQNMLLTACAMGIDSLWIADVLYAHNELSKMMMLKQPFIAAVAFGKAAQHQTPRKPLNEKMTRFSETDEKHE